MTLTQLEIFSLVAELRGFTLAAHRLGISQSAVSHAMKSLEQELGVELLRRHQSAVELSDIGEQLLLRARAMLGEQLDQHHVRGLAVEDQLHRLGRRLRLGARGRGAAAQLGDDPRAAVDGEELF